MKQLLSSIKINVNNQLFNKDPESSDLGKKIIEHSIILIHEIGFDAFTFKKLGEHIGSNESSIYRYFDNKHKLLLYLTSWYWAWIEYQLVLNTNSISNPFEKLKRGLEVVAQENVMDFGFEHINEILLHQIIISESSKSYLTKEVDAENKEGYFLIYKRLVKRIGEMISQVDPNYAFPQSLASTAVESVLHQQFLKQHFLSITNCNAQVSPLIFVTDLVLNNLKTNT